ncbi:MAG: LysE family translocator [Limisphaerales bacterium]
MSVKIFLFYLAAWSLAALTPGPAVMCSVAQSTRYGFRSSLAGISGLQFGNFLFFICIALGLGALLATATVAFSVLRVLGAIYLFYIGVRIIVASFRRSSMKVSEPLASIASRHSLFLQGLLVQVTNPKALLFVSALLPQFIEPHRSLPLQLVVLLFTTVAVDTVVLSSYAFFARRGIQAFRSSRLSAWLERVFGAALVFFGFRLLLSRK